MTEHDTTTRMPVSPRSAEEAVRGYLATWNVIDEDDRGRLLDQFWSPEVSYTDPLMSLTGRNELEAAIAGVHEQFPGMFFSLIGQVDSHHAQLRFQWGLGPADAEPVAIGFDVIVLGADGLIQSVYGFLDQTPAPSAFHPDLVEHAAYAIAHLRDFAPHPEVADYIEQIASTFERSTASSWCTAPSMRSRKASGVVMSSSSLSRASPKPRPGGTLRPTGGSRRYAPGTCRATSSSSRAYPRTTTRADSPTPYVTRQQHSDRRGQGPARSAGANVVHGHSWLTVRPSRLVIR